LSLSRKNKLKILHIGNGNAFKIRAILKFLTDRDHDIHFIPLPQGAEKWDGVTYHIFPPVGRFSKLQVIKNMLAARQIAKKIKPDIIHAHHGKGTGWYGAFCNHHPFVIHAYGSDLLPYYYGKKDMISKILTSYTFRKADRIIVTGIHMIEGSAHLNIPREKFKVLLRGVNLNIFRAGLDTSSLRRDLQIDDLSPVVLSPRYQIDESLYNIDTIIRSIPIVKKTVPNMIYIQLYDGTKEKEKLFYEEIAKKLGVSENYRMIKAVENEKMPYFYNLADIVLSVTSTDGFPVTVLEASACGTPIIASRLDYTSEWFIDGENGILISDRNHEELAEAIIRLYQNGPMREKMGTVNRRLAEERADYEKCMLELEAMYYALLR
jgi:glycosyltransferase involved in cell wall biosynthesis